MRHFISSALILSLCISSAFANENHNNKKNSSQSQTQGQAQGQIGINAADQSFEATVSSVNEDHNHQTSVGAVDSHDVVEGDTVDFPVNTAAPVFAGACAQGASLQLGQTGASVGSGNPVCDFATVAGLYIAAGDRATALQVAAEARNAARHRARVAWWRSLITFGLF